MRKILFLLIVLALAVVAAYVAGYWPQRGRLRALDDEKTQLQQRVDVAEAKVRAGQLLGELLTLEETVEQMNYGQARGLSSPFFDRVRAEAALTADPGLRQALGGIQQLRDAVTIALTQGDPAALNHLRDAERRLRAALGYPAPAAATPVPAPTMDPALPAPGTMPPAGSPAASPTSPASPVSPGPTTATPTAPPTANPLGVPTPTPAP